MTQNELNEVIRKHQLWLNDEGGGERANLCNADISGLDMSGTDMRNADLCLANLCLANLCDTNLCGANLYGANLSSANLGVANLRGANLHYADLSGADLRDADLRDANLRDANLYDALMYHANMCDANLDYSCLPLWCGSLSAHFDDRQLKQIAYHLVKAGLNSKNASEETKNELAKLIDFANGFHRADECGIIKHSEDIKEEGNNGHY